MRKLLVALLIVVLGSCCFSTLISQTIAQTATQPTTDPTSPLIIRWMRFRGAINQWGDNPYQGSVTVNAKTANVPPPLFKPWVGINAVWSNEQRPFASTEKIVGEFTYTHYNARLVLLLSIRGARANPEFDLNVTGLWNVNKIVITSKFDENGALTSTAREVTLIVTRAKGQLHITDDWKKFDINIEGVNELKGVAISMTTTTSQINPFSYQAGASATISDLIQVVRCFRAMPGFGNFLPELDYNMDSKIDLADLTTVAANV